LSSAILYLAIVAIWAVVLVPRWLRLPPVSQPLESNLAEPVEAGRKADLAWAEEGAGGPGAAGSAGPADAGGPADAAGPADAGGLGGAAGARGAAGRTAAGSGTADRRARMLQARRRTLITLMVLTAGAVVIAVTHLAAAWVIIPPVAMLAVFARLLREAARIDTDRARAAAARQRSRAVARAQAGTATGAGTAGADAPTQPAGPADHPQPDRPDAEVIDISARVVDQLYDQYADAEVRAVGD
jgi:hypothetical protein